MRYQVELQPAHRWVCPECGAQNYCDGWIAELNEDERREMFEDHGIEATTGDWLTVPEEVSCADCGMEFDVKKAD